MTIIGKQQDRQIKRWPVIGEAQSFEKTWQAEPIALLEVRSCADVAPRGRKQTVTLCTACGGAGTTGKIDGRLASDRRREVF